jgi:hypothetical protein
MILDWSQVAWIAFGLIGFAWNMYTNVYIRLKQLDTISRLRFGPDPHEIAQALAPCLPILGATGGASQVFDGYRVTIKVEKS